MIDDATNEGYGEYRAHLMLINQVTGTYIWNDGALMKFNERLKDALDPNGILARGNLESGRRGIGGEDGRWGKAVEGNLKGVG